MKNLKQICVTILLACATLTPAWAVQYCEEPVTLANPNYAGNTCNFNLTCQKINNNYVIVADITTANYTFNYSGGFNYSQPWKKGDAGYYSISSYVVTTNGNKRVTITFPWEPQFRANGQALGYFPVTNGMGTSFNCGMKEDVTWGVCTPPDTHNPVITSVAAQSTTQTSITVRVTATDNQANDTGVASITVTRRGSTPSQTQNYSPAEASIYHDFVFSGLTAGTTYTFDVTVTDAAGRTASTSQNLTTQAAVVDNTPPTISSAAAENIKATTADIRVQATDNIGVTRVVIKNGETTIKDENISSTASLNQVFTLTGLTKNTTYNNIKVIVYDARSNGSNIYNVPSFTTKNTNTIYFVKSGTSATGGWGATPKVHYTGGWEASAWPGINMTNTGMTNCDNSQIWRAEIPDNTNVVVFNNGNSGSGNQTENKTPFANQYFNWERNAWYSPENLYILGEGDKFGNWTRSDDFKFSTWNGSTPTSVTKTLRLTGNSYYQFKIQYYDGVTAYWRGNNGTMESNNCTKWLMNQENNCQIHTGSTGNYIFTYDFTANKLSVTYPVPPVGCSGNGTASQQTRIDYTVTYAGGNMIFNVRSQNGNPVIECDLCYGTNTSYPATSRAMTISNGEATYSLPATGELASGPLYFYFYYKNTNNTKSGTASSLSDGNRFTYNIGGCVLDDNIPYMLSASESSKTSTSVTLNVSGIVNIDGVETATTQYVVSTNGGSSWSEPLTASTNQITVTGLSANTVYTVLVKAYYNGEESTNTKTVSARTSRESQCSGTGLKHFTQNEGTPVDFDLEYDSSTGNVTITVQPTSGPDNVTYLQVDYLPAYGGQTSVYSATFSAPAASVTFNPHSYNSGNVEGTDIYFRFLYSINGFGTRWMTAENLSSGDAHILYYRLGDCPQETESDPPCMNPISANDITPSGTSVTVAVSADDGDQPAPTKFLVSTASTFATSTEYTAAAGAITITGLTPCSDYTYYIAAKDRSGNISTSNTDPSCRYKSVTFTTTASVGNMALHQPTTVSYTEDAGKTANYAVDGDRGTRWATGSEHNEEENWIEVDLGSVQVVNSVRIYWENAYSRNYQILFSYDGSNYYSVYHQTTDPSRGNGVNDYQNHPLACPTPTRYVKVQAAVGSYAGDWGLSIWELEVYGSASCAGLASTPHMLCAETVSVGTDEAVIAVSSVDAETAPQNMKYIVSATSGEAGYKQLTSVYTFNASQYIAGTLKHLKVGGLLPDVPYSLSITAVDAAGVASDNSLMLNFRTAAGGGACTWEDNEKQDCAGSQDFSEGYTVSIENNTPDDDHFTVTTTLNDTKSGLVVYFQRIPNLAGDACGVVGEQQMNLISGQTYSLSVDKSALPDEIDFRIKFAYAGGLANTKPISFDKNATCSSGFVIYHYDDAPTSTAVTSSEASSISDPILYYRHFTPDAFEDVTFPFDIDSVRIYDTDDHQYYKLTAQYKAGTTHQGNFYLRVFPSAGSNGASFTNSWEDGTNALPQKNTAYSIRFPNDYGYYANKYILFHGHPGDIATSLTLGTRPTTDDLYKVYPNPTMSAQALGAKAYVTTDRSENLYWKEDDATVQTFETYVLANENTMKRMRRIAAWSEGDDTPTSIEDVRDAMAIHACIVVYSLTGQKIGEWHNCSFGDAEDAIALRGQKGCYILVSEGQTHKMIIQ